MESEIKNLIEMLQSDDSDQRYLACEKLKALPSISPDALDTLRLATQEKNPDVANIALQVILDIQIKKLESHRILLEKSVPNSTMIVVAIAAFITIFSCVVGVAGTNAFIGPSLGEQISERPILMVGYIVITTILTVPTVIYFRDSSKQKDAEALERTNNEIQDLKKKLQEIK